MTSTSSFLLRLAVIAAVTGTAAGLSACGRKNDPELPTVGAPESPRPVGIPMGSIEPSKPKPPKEKKSFLLDPLL